MVLLSPFYRPILQNRLGRCRRHRGRRYRRLLLLRPLSFGMIKRRRQRKWKTTKHVAIFANYIRKSATGHLPSSPVIARSLSLPISLSLWAHLQIATTAFRRYILTLIACSKSSEIVSICSSLFLKLSLSLPLISVQNSLFPISFLFFRLSAFRDQLPNRWKRVEPQWEKKIIEIQLE